MFSSFSTIGAMNAKSIGSVMPTPLYYYTFNTSTISGTTINVDTTNSTNTQTLTLSSTAGLNTVSMKEGNQCFSNGNKLYNAMGTSLSIPTATGLTVSFWFNVIAGNGTGNCIIFGLGQSTTSKIYVFLSPSSNQIICNTIGSNQIFNQSLTTGTWRHLCFTWVGTTHKSYINGVQMSYATSSSVQLPDQIWTSLSVGKSVDNVLANSYALIDCVRVYNTALTASQIQSIYTAGN